MISSLYLQYFFQIVDCKYQSSPVHPLQTIDISEFALPISPYTMVQRRPIVVNSDSPTSNTNMHQSHTSSRKFGRIRFKVKSRTENFPNVGDSSKSIAQRNSEMDAQSSLSKSSNSNYLSIDTIARQQAVRRVYLQYKKSLIDFHLLSVAGVDPKDSFSVVTKAQFGYSLFPFFK
jgi:uncharacterized protein YnzC (UPF0291/DUF896 family)